MIKLLLVGEGARFAGIEGHLLTLLQTFSRDDVQPHLALFHRGLLAERAERLGVPVTLIERASKYDRAALRQARRLVADIGADVVHTHGYLANVMMAAALEDHTPALVTTVHGAREPFGGLAGLKMSLNLYLDRRAMRRRCRRVIIVASALADDLVRHGVSRDCLRLIYNGLPPARSDPRLRIESRTALELAPDAPAFAFVGRIEPVKDPLAFVEFARLVHDVMPNAVFLIAGEGPLLEAMRERVLQTGLLPRFRFLGFLDDLDPFFAATDALVLTSRHEGVPLTVLEAMRAGRPVIAPTVGGLPEVLGGIDGLLAPTRAVRQLAALATRLLRHPVQFQQSGAAVRARFEDRFTAAEMTQRLLAVYREALEESS
jgi:glycosyltransferase involved in cell wall biosynthesis